LTIRSRAAAKSRRASRGRGNDNRLAILNQTAAGRLFRNDAGLNREQIPADLLFYSYFQWIVPVRDLLTRGVLWLFAVQPRRAMASVSLRTPQTRNFGFADPDKIEIHDGSKAYVITRSGSDWSSNGTKMDSGAVSDLIDKIRDLSATKFPESGFTAPALDLTVTSDSGKRIEKVQISKHGDSYLAKRENEPALYELPASTVAELQKSAASLKPAAAPPAPPTKK